MNIEKIQIRNFRSIEDAELELMPRCRVLVGINESGKSNLLKAISSLGTFVPTRIDDAREPSPSEDPIRRPALTSSSLHAKTQGSHKERASILSYRGS
ncbi:AAA family ATPase [Tardiphaga sp. 1201_B9_N1_1]|uniref:AAA family ATPase n=1 Tax=unclassified Tardiphaga TaxID=2631404 RepID=UPI003F229A61